MTPPEFEDPVWNDKRELLQEQLVRTAIALLEHTQADGGYWERSHISIRIQRIKSTIP